VLSNKELLRQAKLFAKFFGGLKELFMFVKRNPRLLHRGSGPLWLIKRTLAEWQFRQVELNEFEFTAFLTKAATEDINMALDRLKSDTLLLQYCQQLMYLVEYLLVRMLKPETVVETGVADGFSSAVILQALEDNNSGELYSIDLPPRGQRLSDGHIYSLPSGKQVGWAIPRVLYHRWHLILGDSSQKLPRLLQELGEIDIFIHDSLHTEKHMMFEYETAWPSIKQGGLLLSDNIGTSFHELSKRINRHYVCVNFRQRFFGGIIK
jgi:predicted O-methyltransferase YrrM